MVDNEYAETCKIGFRRERGTVHYGSGLNDFRSGYGGNQTTPTALGAAQVLAMDKVPEDMDIPEPLRKLEEANHIGDGRTTGMVIPLGYDVVEQDIAMDMMTGIWLYAVLGKVVTDGTDLDPAITDASITRDSGTVIGGFSGLSVDAHIGRIARVTNGTYVGYVYTITDNDATTLTVNSTLPTDLATSNSGGSPTVEILMAPYTHTMGISSAATQTTRGPVYLPSFILHYEQGTTTANTATNTYGQIRDLVGCVVKKLVITIEKGAKVKCAASFMVPRAVAGTAQTSFPKLTDAIFTWDMLDRTNSSFTYATNAVFGTTATWFNECTNIEITIENTDLTIEQVQGDPYGYKVFIGKQDYSVKFTYFPNTAERGEDNNSSPSYDRLLYALRNMKPSEYDGELAMTIRLARSATDYVQIAFPSMYVSEFPNKLVPIGSKEVSVDVTLRGASPVGNIDAGTCVGTVVDSRNTTYYGDT